MATLAAVGPRDLWYSGARPGRNVSTFPWGVEIVNAIRSTCTSNITTTSLLEILCYFFPGQGCNCMKPMTDSLRYPTKQTSVHEDSSLPTETTSNPKCNPSERNEVWNSISLSTSLTQEHKAKPFNKEGQLGHLHHCSATSEYNLMVKRGA